MAEQATATIDREASRAWLPQLPAPAGPLGAYFVSRAVVAFMMSLPLSASVAHVVGQHPRGDAILWDGGGEWLFEASRLIEPALAGISLSTALVGLAGSFALLVPMAVVIATLRLRSESVDSAGPTPPARRLLGIAAERFGTLSLLMGVVLLLQALAYALWVLLSSIVIRSLAVEQPTRDLGWLGALAVGVLVPWFIGVAHDVARVGAVRRALGLLDSVELALRFVGRGARRTALAAGWRGLCAAGCLVGAAWAGIVIGCQSPARLIGVVVVHQAALLGAVWLRASWLRWIGERLG